MASGGTSGFNWRKSFDENLLKILRDQVMDGPSEVFDIVQEPKAKKHFATVPKGWAHQTWHIYTLSILLAGRWQEGNPDLPPVRIPITTP